MNKTTNNTKKKTARSLALESLIALERDGRYSNLEINSALVASSLEGADRGLYTRLVYGVTERRITLDYIIGKYSRIPADGLDPDVRCALRMGIYQLVWMDRIPEHAAVGESAGLVARRSTGFVNAILRSFLRDGKKYDLPDKTADFMEYLSVAYSVPRDLCELLYRSAGEEIEALLEAMNREPQIALRVNRLKISAEEAAEKVSGTVSAIAPDIVKVPSLDETVKAGMEEGLWFVQDEASRITSASVGAKPGEVIADTCACPGGKSFSMAIDMENRGTLHSFDLHKNKLSLIRSGAAKLGITIIETGCRDAREPAETLIGKADRVLCDAPCSGLGVIAKKPDIRYKDLSSIGRLPEVQYPVLCGAAAYVKDGGVLVYSTCTINRAENEEIVEKFLSEHPEYALRSMRTFWPHRDGCDGFFCAVMEKK
ncbi:MAG: 16S rRNA (cytosine(967)-C(5))-methyltransferase RsmB [Clostridia bacterium]|nr:16S rRNA (cytosine(967)-C(5))-methyltransferase RsmB [Clostridia bacterium]